MKNKASTKKLTAAAMFTAVSLTLYLVEAMIPPVVPIPGVKIGLAYIPVLFVAFVGGGWKMSDAALVLAARVLLSALVNGNPTALLFSISGGILAVTSMAVTKLFVKKPYGAAFAGIFAAVMHNTGQLAAASFVYTQSVWAYLPYLLISAILGGLFTGTLIYAILRKPSKAVNKIKFIN